MSIEAMKQARKELKDYYAWDEDRLSIAMSILDNAIEQAQKQEPVAWMWKDGTLTADPDYADGTWIPLYAAPPKREWVGLTEDEREAATGWSVEHIETKLKEKNT